MFESESQQLTLDGTAPPARRRKPTEVTFKGGLTEPFHRWFRLTPSYSPVLVNNWLDKHPPVDGRPLLDPFAGAGTTCIVGATRGLRSIGVEINPLLAFVSRVSTTWKLDADELLEAFDSAFAAAQDYLRNLPDEVEAFAAELNTTLPVIHNVYRWWRPEVLRQLLALREASRLYGGPAADHLLLALAQCVYPTANITLGRLQIAFVDRDSEDIDAMAFFNSAVQTMIEDLRAKPAAPGAVDIINDDSRHLAELGETVGGVFCSPPYPNRYSYVWNTRPHLYLLELISTARAAADIDCASIGGTWGQATSNLQKQEISVKPNVLQLMGHLLDNLGAVSLLMRNYLCKYFNDLDTHLAALRPRLADGAHVGYVVGNTETKALMVETHELLGGLMEMNGFATVDIKPLRARHSGFGLVEAVVSAQV